MIEGWDVAGIARNLIVDYYDRMYYKHRPWTPDLELDLENYGLAETELKQFWDTLKLNPSS